MGQERKKQKKLINNRLKQKKFIAKYGVYNTPSKFVEKDPPKNQPVNVEPSKPEPPKPEIKEFYDKLSKRMDSTEIAGQVKSEITDIIKAAGITEQQDVDKFVEKSYSDIREHVKFIYNPKVVSETKMSIDAPSFFYTAYKSLTESNLSAPDQIIAAQKIANVMIKNYSPVAFADKGFDHYGNDYVLNNREDLDIQLRLLGFTDTNAMAEEVYATLRGESIKKPEPPKPEPVVPDSVDMAAFAKRLQPMVDDAEEYKGYNVFRKIAIKNILKEAGVDVGEESDPLGFVDVIKDAYASEKLSREAPQPMRNVAKSLFIASYNALTQKGINPTNKIETAQKLTNEFITHYSPAFFDENLLKYANNYITNDNELFRECLTALKFPENEIKSIVGEQTKPETKPETKPVSSEARIAVYEDKLKAYNNMYKINIDSNKFVESVTEAWDLMTSSDKQNMSKGQKVMNDIFKDTLKKAFDVEKDIAYDEHRLPEYVEIIKSTNELMRSAMYGFTDMYHNAKRTELFEATAFGGLNDKDMADLTVGQSQWSMDQKSDEAWDIQSKEAKNIAEKWMKGDKPHEKMIAEMKALVEANEKGIVSRKEMVDKLTAAEWLLENDEKMMIDDPYDPYNKVPNWGNRYWKTLAETRETLGIDKHTSMRDMIQADYAAAAKAVNNRNYNLTQINYYVLDKDVRELADSRDVQMEQFATMSAAVTLTKPKDKNDLADDMTADRVQYPVKELDERDIMKHEPKIYNFVGEPTTEKNLTKENQGQAK